MQEKLTRLDLTVKSSWRMENCEQIAEQLNWEYDENFRSALAKFIITISDQAKITGFLANLAEQFFHSYSPKLTKKRGFY